MLSYQEMRNANLEENRRMLQELGVKIPIAGERPVFNKPKISTKRPKQTKIPEPPPEPEKDDKKSDESDQPGLRSSFRVRLKTKNYYEDSYISEAPRPKVPRVRPDNSYGSIEGVEVGREWATRMECSYDLVHRPTVAGIHGGPEGAYSVALSGGYEDDIDLGDSFTYTGEGGRDLKGTALNPKNLRTAAQSKDQTLDRGNLALSISVDTQNPVRVIRGYKLTSPYAPEEGYRYDGLYLVKKFWVARGKSGFKVFKFAFVRCDPEPAPWTTVSTVNSPTTRSPTSPTTPSVTRKKNLEACEAPSLEVSESENMTYLGTASKDATEPEERASVKKRVSFSTKDSVRLFESEEPDEDDVKPTERVLTRRSSKAQTTESEIVKSANSQEDSPSRRTAAEGLQENSNGGDEKSEETSDSSPRPGRRAQKLKDSPKSVLSVTKLSPKNRSPMRSYGDKDDTASEVQKNKSLKTSKGSSNDNSSPKSPRSHSELKSSKSSPASPQNHSPKPSGDIAKIKNDSKLTQDQTAPVFIRKSNRPPKPTEKIKSPGIFLWLQKSPQLSEYSGFATDAQKSNDLPQSTQENSPKKSTKVNAVKKSPSEISSTKESLKLSVQEKSSDKNLNSKKSPKVDSGKRSVDDISVPRKPPKSGAQKDSTDGTPKSLISPKLSSEKKSPNDTPKSKKSPKQSPVGTPKSKKSPKFIPEKKLTAGFPSKQSQKSPKLSTNTQSPSKYLSPKTSPKSKKQKAQSHPSRENASSTSRMPEKRGRGRPPSHGRYSQKFLPIPASDTKTAKPETLKSKESSRFPDAKSPIDGSKSKKSPKSPKITNVEKESRGHSKTPTKISTKSPTLGKLSQKKLSSQSGNESCKSPKKLPGKLSERTKKFVTKMPKSPSVEKAASILSKAKAPRLPKSSFKKKLAMIASARAKELKNMKRASTLSNSATVPSSSPKYKQEIKPPLKAVKPVPEKHVRKGTKRSASPLDVSSPNRKPSPGKEDRNKPVNTSATFERPVRKKARISQESEPVIRDTVSSDETENPPTLQRYDEKQTQTATFESPKRKATVTESPARETIRDGSLDREIPSSPEREMSDSSVPSSPCWTPVSPASPMKSSPVKASPNKQTASATKNLEDYFSDDEILAMMKFSLCPCSDDSSSKVTIKMVDGRWIEVREPKGNVPAGNEMTGSNFGVQTENETSERRIKVSSDSTLDTIDAAKSSS